jgi:methionyl-tRNA synthetase
MRDERGLMECLVCHATTADGTVCAQCGYDSAALDAGEPARILSAREAFKQRSTAFAPQTRVKTRDKLVPWLALALGLGLFVLWARTCFG